MHGVRGSGGPKDLHDAAGKQLLKALALLLGGDEQVTVSDQKQHTRLHFAKSATAGYNTSRSDSFQVNDLKAKCMPLEASPWSPLP